jgi:superfamily II DNA or RNA helicase
LPRGVFMDNKRRFDGTSRVALWLASGGKCEQCGCDLEPGWHADHVQPWSKGGQTDVVNGQALCPGCNLRKGAAMTMRLREWQQNAMDAFQQSVGPDFMVVATPGAGKTTFAAAVADWLRRVGRVQQIIVVVPTEHLKRQWAKSFKRWGIDIDHTWENSTGAIARDMHGVAVTYAAVGSQPHVLRKHVGTKPTLVILDEVHHCGDKSTWGESIKYAFEKATKRLCLSGTPFRSDNNAIPFVKYPDGAARADFCYDYGRAIEDGVCRAMFFPAMGGEMEWSTDTGIQRASFDDQLDEVDANRRLNTALLSSGQWMREAITQAHRELVRMRREDQDAAGLILAKDVQHADAVAGLLKSIALCEPVVVTSEDAEATKKIERFEASSDPWIVAVKMVSEGVDIPRLRVGVYATNVTTEMFFRQAVGRLARCEDAHDDPTAYMIIPDDVRLRTYAERIKRQREHALEEIDKALEQEREGRDLDGQLPLVPAWQPISSTGYTSGVIFDEQPLSAAEIARAEQTKSTNPAFANIPNPVLAMFARVHTGIGVVGALPVKGDHGTKADRKKRLRAQNSRRVAAIVRRCGVEYAEANAILNGAVGVAKVDACTEAQLERRLALAIQWDSTGVAPHGQYSA